MPKHETLNCYRCGAFLLADAEVCATCCAPQTAVAPQPFQAAAGDVVAAPAQPASTSLQTGLAAWPFGQADAEAAAEVASRTEVSRPIPTRDMTAELAHYSTAQNTTHVLTAIPAQRPAMPAESAEAPAELESVPSVGPNPFLSAARMQQARDEAAVEGYPV